MDSAAGVLTDRAMPANRADADNFSGRHEKADLYHHRPAFCARL